MKSIGILGGTFNPVHNGHLAMAKAVQKKFKLDQIVFIPSGTPPHKSKEKIIANKHRLKMLQLALKGKNKHSISLIEIKKQKPAYAIDTFKQLAKKYSKPTRLYYVMGMDSFNDMVNWKMPAELFKYCDLIVCQRPGFRPKSPFLKCFGDKICFVKLNQKGSATEIRSRLKQGRSIGKLVPVSVLKYIAREKLY